MPGYRPLQRDESFEHVVLAQQCDTLTRDGHGEEAALMLEKLIAELEASGDDVPMWPYGRLAFVYRKLQRHADEVALLERYIERDPGETEVVRFKARLSKARALLARREKAKIMPLRSDKESTVRVWSVRPGE
jgi:hypothetical protein